jgi:hypothetical protein
MPEGHAKLTVSFIEFASACQLSSHPPDSEPKLALTIGAYARGHLVLGVLTDCGIIDLGSPDIYERTSRRIGHCPDGLRTELARREVHPVVLLPAIPR